MESLELLVKAQAKMSDYWQRSERAIDNFLADLIDREIQNRDKQDYHNQLLADLQDFWSDYFSADLIDQAYQRSKYKSVLNTMPKPSWPTGKRAESQASRTSNWSTMITINTTAPSHPTKEVSHAATMF
ncbi:hypothetical protein AWM75_07845 [Aerococcus urinaehominis]|uniref:Uncharacterized protein n=1 Tax=Aerococcus urinaehominis TaxID=128944 RepID=A0A0X8FM89_9LACT|nr:hypothetical protein [Aerococcus urinaehominis]AMB99884.1 hypothetical protein AWM75_07845 [Aerococcus urinaehominis]SDM53117.1 hypothetical protein SAMN04487985_12128 [Aerococcus urinaehominis]